MAEVKKVTLKRFNGTDNDDLHPTTDWEQIEDKPTTFTPTSHTLNSHSDVNASAPTDGQVLAWDNDNQQWIASTSAGGGGVDKADLQQLYIYGKASVAITIGDVVQFAGAQGDHILIKPAVQSEINSNPDYVIGIAEATLAQNDFGYVLVNGRLTLDTTDYTAGDILYFDSEGSTAGALTTTEPTEPNSIIQMAAVSIGGNGNGEFVVRTNLITRNIHEINGLQDELDAKVDLAGDTMTGDLSVTRSGANGNISATRSSGATVNMQAQSAKGVIGTDSNHDLQLKTNATGRMTIDTSGNVGIGTSSPTGKLNIVDGTTKGLEFEEITGGIMRMLAYDRTNSVEVPIELRGDNIAFETNGIQRANITDAGLDVSGNIAVTGTVDGVDIATFKSDYDSHTHDDRYYTETETDSLLSGKSDTGHTHDDRYYTETETDSLLSGKSDTGHTHDDRYYTETETDSLLSGKSDTGHTHDDRYYTETETDSLLSGKSDTGHTHDDRYYTETETDSLLSGKSDTGHTHDDIYYTETEVDSLLSGKENAFSKNTAFNKNFGTTSGTVAQGNHTHAQYAPLASPAFTGNPTAPTPTAGDNDTTLATTAFVSTAISNLVNGASASFDTLKEIQDAMATDAELAAAISGLTIGNGTQTVSAGSGLTGGGSFTANQTGNSSVTVSHADTSSQGSVNNSGATVIQDVTLDTYGHTTGLGSVTITPALIGAQPAGTYDNYSSWTLQAQNSAGTSLGSSPITSGDTAVIKAGSNVTLSWADDVITINATDTNTVYTHPTHPGDDINIDTGALTGATVISDLDFNITSDTLGHITDANATIATRNLTLADLGYTGATNANYITNNNQLTNGAGYTTYSANQAVDTTSSPTFANLYTTGNTQLGNGNGDTVHINDIVHIGATDSGDSNLYFGEGSTNNITYGAHWNWNSGYRFTWSTRNNGTDSTLFYYDTNSTSYIYWDRSHHAGNASIDYLSQIHFNDNVRFYDNGNDSDLIYKFGDTNTGSIQFYTGGNVRAGYIYSDGAGANFGLLNKEGQWAFRTTASTNYLYHDGGTVMATRSDGVEVYGNILLTGTATTTNQGRTIDFTGFDKEGTTDFSDRAYIQHTTNTGGHSGSVLVISSQNDATDGIAFLTNASSPLKWNSQNLATESYVTSRGYVTSSGVTSVATGGGLTGGTITGTGTISHADTSSQGSVNNSGNTFIQDITLDTYGHITAITSATASVGVTSVATGGGLTGGTITGTGTISHADTSSQASVNNSGASFIQDITLDTYGHITGIGTTAISAGTIGAAAASHGHNYDDVMFAVDTDTSAISTTSTGYSNTGLAVYLPSTALYYIRIMGIFRPTSTGTGIRLALIGSSGGAMTFYGGRFRVYDTASVGSYLVDEARWDTFTTTAAVNSGSGILTTSGVGAQVNGIFELEGYARVTSSTSLTLQYGSEVSGQGIILYGRIMSAARIGD